VVINVGDKYDDGGLCLIPHTFAKRVLDEFEAVRLINTVTWAKSNPTPSPQRRRLVNSTEPFFDFAKSNDFYVDANVPIKDTRPSQRADWKDPASRSSGGFQGRQGSRIGQKYYRMIDESALSPTEKANARRDLDAVLEEVRLGTVHDIRMKIRGMHALPFGGQPGGRMSQIVSKGYTIIRFRGNTHQLDWIECPVETLRGIGHPAVYPQRLIEQFIRRLTRPGELVLDPFLGSGTTALACLATGRHWLGIELSPEFVTVAEKRIAKAMEREAAPGPLWPGQPHHERQLTA
jgi:site-specific DNA-methyltransferase (adenine-specific)